MFTGIARRAQKSNIVLRTILALALAPLIVPLALTIFVAIVAAEVIAIVMTIPIIPLYIGKPTNGQDWLAINKINMFMIFNDEIMDWYN